MPHTKAESLTVDDVNLYGVRRGGGGHALVLPRVVRRRGPDEQPRDGVVVVLGGHGHAHLGPGVQAQHLCGGDEGRGEGETE